MHLDRQSVWSLVFFTTLTQVSVGGFMLWGLLAMLLPTIGPFLSQQFTVILLLVLLLLPLTGIFAAALHLGFPLRTRFSIVNLRTSWLSREAVWGIGFGLLVAATLLLRIRRTDFGLLDCVIILAGITCGLCLVYAISRLYMLRTVPAWNHAGTPAAFFITSFLLGAVAIAAVWFLLNIGSAVNASAPGNIPFLGIWHLVIILLVGLQVVIFAVTNLYLNQQKGTPADSVSLLWTKLRGVLFARFLTAGVGVTLLILRLPPVLTLLAYLLLLISELLGRYLFYGFYRRSGY